MNAPDKVTEIKAAITLVFTFCTALWGWIGWAIIAFLFCLALDYVTGSWAARAHGEWSSDIARQGLWHKLGEIVALLVAMLTDAGIAVTLNSAATPILGPIEYKNYFTLVVCLWYIFTELGSIIENAGKLGAPVPKWLAKGIAQLRDKTDAVGGSGETEKKE